MNEIQLFSNPQFGEVRVTVSESGEPLFCLLDLCRVLEIKNVKDVKNRLGMGGVTIYPIVDNIGRTQQANFVNEDGLYDVILDSRKPEAKKFRKWVTSEVLPSIRKNGAYMTGETLEKALASPDFLIQLATNLKEEKQKRIQAEEQVKANAPKVLFADAVATSERSCLVSELAKILCQNGVNIGQNRLFEWLRQNGYLCSKGEYWNLPTQKAIEMGLFEVKKTAVNKPDGTILTTSTTKVTGKGQVYFVNKFLAA